MDQTGIDAWAEAYVAAQSDPNLLANDEKSPLWWAIEKGMFYEGETDPEDFWAFILTVLEKSPGEYVLSLLAAGPLEELISNAGEQFIERIENQARRSAAFRHLLGGVWRHGASVEIWRRVEAARGASW